MVTDDASLGVVEEEAGDGVAKHLFVVAKK